MPPKHLPFMGSYASKIMIQNRLTISLTPASASGVQPSTTLILRMIGKTVKRYGGRVGGVLLGQGEPLFHCLDLPALGFA